MKIRMSKSYTTYELYDTIEINKEDYPELEGLSDAEAVQYLQENMWDFQLNNSDEDCLQAEFEFNRDIVKDKFTNEEHTIHLLKEE
jgi:hypothetical protein